MKPLTLALTIAAAAYLARRAMLGAGQGGSSGPVDYWTPDTAQDDPAAAIEPDQSPTFLESVAVTLSPSTYDAGNTDAGTAARNEKAFLDMIAYAEGTNGPDGYKAMFGYPRPDRIADNLDDHPRQFFSFTNGRGETLKTSAAGRYQFLSRTWDALAKSLNLPDFGPASQDAAALELIRQRGALNDVRAGRTADAIAKIAPIWASMPGAGYAQPERKLTALLTQYRAAGGAVA